MKKLKKEIRILLTLFVVLNISAYFSCSNDSQTLQNSNVKTNINSETKTKDEPKVEEDSDKKDIKKKDEIKNEEELKIEEEIEEPVVEAPYEIPDDRPRKTLSSNELSGLSDIISSLTQDTVIKITGEIGDNELNQLMTAIDNSNFKIDLDLTDSDTECFRFNFAPVSNLRSISFPKTMNLLDEEGLKGCKDLKSITVDNNNPHYSDTNGVLFNKQKIHLICCPAGKTGLYKIPNMTMYINNGAFYNSKELQSVIVPATVENIGSKAFEGCDKLKSLIFEHESWKYQNTEWIEKTLSDPKENAKYFTTTLSSYSWKKR